MDLPAPNSPELRLILQEYWDPRSLGRGKAYFEGGRVGRIDIESNDEAGLVIGGDVEGSSAKPYRTSLTLVDDSGQWTVESDECSCPLGGSCKHAVALLLAFVARSAARLAPAPTAGRPPSTARPPRPSPSPPPPPAPPTTPWDQWFAAGNTLPATVLTGAEQHLGFLFDFEPGQPLRALSVKPVWLSRLKAGGWGKAESLRIGSWGGATSLQRLDAAQFDLLAKLRMLTPMYSGGMETFRLDGPRAGALIESILATQLCCWQKPRDAGLSLGEPVALRWHWRMRDDGSQQLVPELAPGLQLLRAGDLWYLDAAGRRLGRVDEDAVLADRLLRMPALLPDHVDHVTRRWHAESRFAALPPPRALAPARVLSGPPRPVLSMMRVAPEAPRHGQPQWMRSMGTLPSMHLARLSFDYEGQRVAPALLPRDERRLVDGALVTIQRNPDFERDAERRLHSAGLVPAKSHGGLPWLLSEKATAADWLPAGSHLHDDPSAIAMHVSGLAAAGFTIEYADGFPIEVLSAPDRWFGEVEEPTGMDWFGVELGIVIGEERVSLLPILARAIADKRLSLTPRPDEPADAAWLAPLDDRRRIPLPLARLRALLAPLLEWLSPTTLTARVPKLAVDVLADLQERAGDDLLIGGARSAQALAERLRNAGRDLPMAAPDGLRGTPRPYQLEGLRWLHFLADAGLGGVLADDMGLGKTLQILMHLLAEKAAQRLESPALVVCPTSVLGNWSEQAAQFVPGLRVLVLHGSQRSADFARIAEHDLIVTTYALLVRDREELLKRRFALAVFDEAHALKNPASQAAMVARAVRAGRRLAVTGTPLENHLGELWAQFDCVLPGLLGTRETFVRCFRTPIEKHADPERQQRLNRRIAPYMLRRSKESVAPELPPKTLIERRVELAGAQRELYETLRLAMHQRVREALDARGVARSSIVILDALLKLRQVCCDPRLVKLDRGRRGTEPPASAKLALLMEMLDELLDEGRRVLLFSQFTGMLDLIEADLRKRDHAFVRLDGSTLDRKTPIRRFQSGDVPLFLISLKAGGVGLNLTAADTVIHYDPWWNPAVENQATDRAHRIGQDKPVFVYKLLCAGTVEEKIQQLQQRKAGLAKAILEGGTRTGLRFDESDIETLFAPMA